MNRAWLRRPPRVVWFVVALVVIGFGSALAVPALRIDSGSVASAVYLDLGERSLQLPETTQSCRRDPGTCSQTEIDAGSVFHVRGVLTPLALSSDGALSSAKVTYDNGQWKVELPNTVGTMLISSGDQVWSLRVV